MTAQDIKARIDHLGAQVARINTATTGSARAVAMRLKRLTLIERELDQLSADVVRQLETSGAWCRAPRMRASA